MEKRRLTLIILIIFMFLFNLALATADLGIYNLSTSRFPGSPVTWGDTVLIGFNFYNSSPIDKIIVYDYYSNGSLAGTFNSCWGAGAQRENCVWNSSLSIFAGEHYLTLFINDSTGFSRVYKSAAPVAINGTIPLYYSNLSMNTSNKNVYVDTGNVNVSINITTQNDINNTYINVMQFNSNAYPQISNVTFINSYKIETGDTIANDSMNLSYAIVTINMNTSKVNDTAVVKPYFWNESSNIWIPVINYYINNTSLIMNLTHFSVYGLFEGGEIYNLTFSNITSNYISASPGINYSYILNITNRDNKNRSYNLSVEKPLNTSAWINSNISLNVLNFSAFESKTINLTTNAAIPGIFRFHIIAILASNASVILNSSHDLNITLNVSAGCGDTQSDPNNCGSCGNVCSNPGVPHTTGYGCNLGQCRVTACSATWYDCDSAFGNGCEMNSECQQPPPQGGSNYTLLWSNAIPAVNFTTPNLFSFIGAPYVARGPGCVQGMTWANMSTITAGQSCNNQMSGPSGSVALDLGAVWVTQDENYIAWNIIGPFVFENNLSICGGSNNSNAAYVIEFNEDGNLSTGCIGNPQSGEGCYPGSDYQIWYFPDTHKSLFAYYNGTSVRAGTGQPAGGNCSQNPGGVCFVANTSVNVMINVTCGLPSPTGPMTGLIIVLNKTVLPQPIMLNFETNSFNFSQGSGPIDMLTDNGQDALLFKGPGMDKGACFMYDNTNETACESNTDGFKCVWKSTFQGKGLCDPEFMSFSEGDACFTYNNSADCLSSTLGNCRWMNDSFAIQKSLNGLGLCVDDFKPMEFGGSGSCDSDCFSCFSKTQCENSNANGGKTYGGCSWYNDSFNPVGWCDVKGMKFGCSQNPLDCFTQSDCENSNWNWSSTYNICRKDANTEICFNGADDNGNGQVDCAEEYCKINAKFCGAGMNTLTGDFKGMDPEEALMQKIMGTNPPNIVNLNMDALNDSTSANESTELNGFSVVVTNLGLGMGVGLKNSSELKACGGNIIDRKYVYAIDKDANVSTGCNITVDSVTYEGYDYLIKYGNYSTTNSTSNNTKQLYACFNNAWILKDGVILPATNVQPIDFAQPWLGIIKTPLECGGMGPPPGQGPQGDVPQYAAAVVVQKADIGNPTKDMKFLVMSVNGSWNNLSDLYSYDKIEDNYYTPGSIGFTPVDCFKEPTKCGTEFALVGGGKFMPFEDCMMFGDEDLDELENCADSDCINAPNCQGQFNLSQDKTAPKVKMSKVDTFPDVAFAMWHTTEPTNGTLKFYYNDSSCLTVNTTLWDEGMPNNPSDDFRPWHNMPLDIFKLGYALSPNTTYYYKLYSNDMAGNPSISTCLNFTTEASAKNVTMKFDFVPKGNGSTDFLGNISIMIDGQTVDVGNYSEKEDLTNVNITFHNPTADAAKNWSLELVGADLFADVEFNFTDAFLANDTGEQGKMFGMENDDWLQTAQNLGVDYVILKIPDEGDALYHCMDNGTACEDVTNTTGVQKVENGTGYSKWKLPLTLGFSTYSVVQDNTTIVYNVSFVNLTAANVTANLTAAVVNKTFTLNITNHENQTRLYNLTVNNGLVNYTSMQQVNLSENQSVEVNITVNVSATGINYYYVIATLANDSTVILNSSDDLNLTAYGVDKMAPTWTETPVNQTVEYGYSFAYDLNATDAHNSLPITYGVNDSSFIINTTSGLLTNNSLLATGTHTILVNATDTAGNTVSSYINITVADTIYPVWTSSNTATVEYATSFVYDANATDANGVPLTYSINDSDFSINSSTGVLTNATLLAIGVHNIQLNATDGTNINSTTLVVTVSDTINPAWTQTPANQQMLYGSSFAYDLNATDQNGAVTTGIIYIVNDTSNFSINSSTGVIANATLLDVGNYSLTVSANDTRGNVISQAIIISVYDNISPAWVNASNATIERLSSLSLQLNATDNYPTGLTYSVNDTTNFNMSASGVLMNKTKLSAGNYLLTITATDASGNANSTTITIAVQDTVIPAINTTPNATAETNGGITIAWANDTQEDVAKYNVYRKTTSNFTVVNNSFKVASNITALIWSDTETKEANATYYYALTAVDASGNENQSAITSVVNATTGEDCTNAYGSWSAWSDCSGGTQTKTQTRTCYISGGTTTNSTSQSCSSGSTGGGGGGGASLTTLPTVSVILTEMPSGQNKIDVENTAIGIYETIVETTESTQNVKITFTKLDSKPTETTDSKPEEKVFRYVEIKYIATKSPVARAKIKFKVEKSWLLENNLQKSDIRMFRYTLQWDELPTTIINEDATHIFFEAETPGFSFFKIAATAKQATATSNVTQQTQQSQTTATAQPEQAVPEPEAPPQEEVQQAPQEEAKIQIQSKLWLVPAIVALVAIGFLGVFLARKGGNGGHSGGGHEESHHPHHHVSEHAEQKIASYYHHEKKHGKSDEEIIEKLVGTGWDKEDVKHLIHKIKNTP